MIDIGLSLTNRIAGGRMYKAVTSFTRSMFASINSIDGLLTDVILYGLSTQAGTPTPDVPAPIVSTTGNVTVKSGNKNLLALQVVGNVTSSGVTRTVNADGSYTFNGTSTGGGFSVALLTPLVLTGPMVHSVGATMPPLAYISLNNNGATMLSNGETSQTFTGDGTTVFTTYVIYFDTGAVLNNFTIRPQIEVGSTPTSYEKNTNSTQTLPLGTTQLRSLPNAVSDRIYKDGSTWKLEQNVGTVVLNGTEAWSAGGITTTDGSFTYKIGSVSYNAYSDTSALSDRFIYNSSYTWTNGYINLNRNGSDILFLCSTQTTVANFKTWLGTNNTTVHYNLETSVTTPITDPTLIAALENIRTYQGITNITASTPVSGSYLVI